MNLLEEVTDLLRGKVSRTNPRNPKSNTGAALIKLYKPWEEELESLIKISFESIQLQFSKDSTDSPAGTAKLTNTSRIIGQRIGKIIEREPLGISTELRLGDLFVEMFKKRGLITLEYPKIRDSSYTIEATALWEELAEIPRSEKSIEIRGSAYEPPAPITGVYQSIGNKRIDLIKNSELEIDTDATWVKAIDKLQNVGWKVNTRVLSALETNRGLFVSDKKIKGNTAKEQKRISKRMEWKFITEKAHILSESEQFYQYMDADYRGRLYCVEPFLNFQGSDLSRGTLLFSKGKEITEEGMQWLAIHTASVFNMSYGIDEIPSWCEEDYKLHLENEGLDNISVDKMTLSDRIRWTNSYMEEIRDAGYKHIISTEAEKPVSFLAACIEWYDVHEALAQGIPHVSHLPIPIDGSNNGWQHLGAISKDTHTGELVGLEPITIQKDFYVQTAKKLIELCTNPRLQEILAEMPMKKIRKGISKRGSMTRAYSAGASKISENMYFDCKAEDYHIQYGITEKDCRKFATLLIKSIDEVCPGPLTTMGYLQNLAAFEIGRYTLYDADDTPVDMKEFKKLRARQDELVEIKEPSDEELNEIDDIVKSTSGFQYKKTYGIGNKHLSWTTPSGFHVHYESWVMTPMRIVGRLDGKYIKHVAQVPSDRPDMRGFMCGVSPNFIHSMDASHMARVIANWSGDFGAVHDSFSTHASDVDELLQETKNQFIEMYNVPNFYDYIQSEIITDATDIDFDQPVLGDLDIGEIVNSDYFFA